MKSPSKMICTDNSLECGKGCEDLQWNHCASTPPPCRDGISERAVRRVKEGILQLGCVLQDTERPESSLILRKGKEVMGSTRRVRFTRWSTRKLVAWTSRNRTSQKNMTTKEHGETRCVIFQSGLWSSRGILWMIVSQNTKRDASSSSREFPSEPRAKVVSGKHTIKTQFLKDRNCDICLRAKIYKASLQKTHWYSRARSGKFW